jgi:hypothetical protein
MDRPPPNRKRCCLAPTCFIHRVGVPASEDFLLWICITRRHALLNVLYINPYNTRPLWASSWLFLLVASPRLCLIFRTTLVSHYSLGRRVDSWKSSVYKQARFSTTEQDGTILSKISRATIAFGRDWLQHFMIVRRQHTAKPTRSEAWEFNGGMESRPVIR